MRQGRSSRVQYTATNIKSNAYTTNQHISIPWESQIFHLQPCSHCQKQIGRESHEVTLPAEAFNSFISSCSRKSHLLRTQTLAQLSQNHERTRSHRTEGSISKPTRGQRRACVFGSAASWPKAPFLKNLFQQQNLASLFSF